MTSTIHMSLEARDLLPKTHVADTGFVNSALFVDARERFGIDLIGPTRGNRQWQAQAGAGFAARDFAIDCPATGNVSGRKGQPKLDSGACPRNGVGDQDQIRGCRLPGVFA